MSDPEKFMDNVPPESRDNVTEGEVRVTNPETGGQKGRKLARFDLLPWGVLWEVAEHYGKGARKYTQVVDPEEAKALCRCARISTIREKSTPGVGVDHATVSGSDRPTPTTPKRKERTASDGGSPDEVKSGNGSTTESTGKTTPTGLGSTKGNAAWHSTDFPPPMQSSYGSGKDQGAQSVGETTHTDPSLTSIITTTPEKSAGSFAENATKDSASLMTTRNWLSGHSPTCPLHLAEKSSNGKIKIPGDRNWEKGYDWSLSFGALQRHLSAWWAGEDIDPETGSNHLAAAAFHVLALLFFSKHHRDLDDRPGRD